MTLLREPEFICNNCKRNFPSARKLDLHQQKEEHYLEGRTVREGLSITPPIARFPSEG